MSEIIKSSKINFEHRFDEIRKQFNCFEEISEGRFMMVLDPSSPLCRKMFKEQPDFQFAGEMIKAIKIGLQDSFDEPYYDFLTYVYNKIPIKQLYVNGLEKDKVQIHERYIQSLLNF